MNPAYRVAYPQVVRNALKELCERAALQGLGEQVLVALKAIDEQLKTDPLAFGDPIRSLADAKLTLMQRIVAPLIITYSVHTEMPVVFVRQFRPFPADKF
jgi:hypothetical protein